MILIAVKVLESLRLLYLTGTFINSMKFMLEAGLKYLFILAIIMLFFAYIGYILLHDN